jgi:hypothetical protein
MLILKLNFEVGTYGFVGKINTIFENTIFHLNCPKITHKISRFSEYVKKVVHYYE